MSDKELITGLKYLGTAYNKEFTKEQSQVWYEFFKNTDYNLFKQAIKRIITTNKFMPSIAEVKEEIALISNPALELKADKEWEVALDIIKSYGRYRLNEAMNKLNPFTKEVIRQIGFERICNSQDIQWERKLFIEIFNSRKYDDQKTLALSEPIMTMKELLKLRELAENKNLMIENN